MRYQKIIIIGYGNTDRQDDGVAWHVLASVARGLGHPVSDPPGEGFFPGEAVQLGTATLQLEFHLQLVPEFAETIAGYDAVMFIDAHTGNIQEDLRFTEIQSQFQASPFTHHLTPQSCLELARALYGKQPAGYLVTIRGYEFGFIPICSQRTQALAETAATQILAWLQEVSES